MHKRLALLAVLLYVASITALSLINLGGVPKLGSSFDDKIYHFIAYFIFVNIVYQYLYRLKKSRALLIAVTFSICYGILLEVLQDTMTRSRTLDVYDMIANTLGIIFGALMILTYKKLSTNN